MLEHIQYNMYGLSIQRQSRYQKGFTIIACQKLSRGFS